MLKPPPEPVDPWVLRQRQIFGDRLRSLRLERDFTQEVLGKRIGMDAKTISRAENARTAIDLDEIHRLARGLAVPTSRLFMDE